MEDTTIRRWGAWALVGDVLTHASRPTRDDGSPSGIFRHVLLKWPDTVRRILADPVDLASFNEAVAYVQKAGKSCDCDSCRHSVTGLVPGRPRLRDTLPAILRLFRGGFLPSDDIDAAGPPSEVLEALEWLDQRLLEAGGHFVVVAVPTTAAAAVAAVSAPTMQQQAS